MTKETDSERQREKLQALLRRCRIEAGLRQVDLAERLGLPQSFVSKYESGERRLDAIELRRVCMAMGVPLVELVRELEDSLK
jgi:transcriptional regulator with XRE-family HTH domain